MDIVATANLLATQPAFELQSETLMILIKKLFPGTFKSINRGGAPSV
jgi:hypothetical protein